jgi:hypothetical protein
MSSTVLRAIPSGNGSAGLSRRPTTLITSTSFERASQPAVLKVVLIVPPTP